MEEIKTGHQHFSEAWFKEKNRHNYLKMAHFLCSSSDTHMWKEIPFLPQKVFLVTVKIN